MGHQAAKGERIKVALVGGGAVGGWITCLLSRNSNLDLSLLVRSNYLHDLRSKGLKLAGWPVPEFLENGAVDPDKNVTQAHNVRYIESCPEEAAKIGEQNFVIVTVKAHALAQALPTITPLMGEKTSVVAVQNGVPWWYFHYGAGRSGKLAGTHVQCVDPDATLWNQIKPDKVIGAVVYCAMELSETCILNYAPNRGGIAFGEPSGEMTPRLVQLGQVFEGSSISTTLTNDIRAALWTKLMGNAFFNPVTALTKVTWGQLACHDQACKMGEAIMEEVYNIAVALGVEMGETNMADRIKSFRSAKIPFKSSMLQDMERGRDPEVAALVSAPLEIALKLGLDTPRLEMLETLMILIQEKNPALGRA